MAVGQMNANKRYTKKQQKSTSKTPHFCEGNSRKPSARQEYLENLFRVLYVYFLALGSLISNILHNELDESHKWASGRVRRQGWVFLWLRLLLFITALLLLMGGDVERNPGPTQG